MKRLIDICASAILASLIVVAVGPVAAKVQTLDYNPSPDSDDAIIEVMVDAVNANAKMNRPIKADAVKAAKRVKAAKKVKDVAKKPKKPKA